MNLKVMHKFDGSYIIDESDGNVYKCEDIPDMEVLCEKVMDELNYVTLRHNLILQAVIKIEDNLKELDKKLEKGR